MKPKDVIEAIERMEMQLEGERMAREDASSQHLRFSEKQTAELERLKEHLAKVQHDNRLLRKTLHSLFQGLDAAAPLVKETIQSVLKDLRMASSVSVSAPHPCDDAAPLSVDTSPIRPNRSMKRPCSHTAVSMETLPAPAPSALSGAAAATSPRDMKEENMEVEVSVIDSDDSHSPPSAKGLAGSGRPLPATLVLSSPPEFTSLAEMVGMIPPPPRTAVLREIQNVPLMPRTAAITCFPHSSSAFKTEMPSPFSGGVEAARSDRHGGRPEQQQQHEESEGSAMYESEKQSTPPPMMQSEQPFGSRSPGGRYPGERVYNEAVRNRDARQAMPGHACDCCRSFLETVISDEAERHKLIQQCSKHRQYRRKYQTPPDYWELDFLDEMEGRN